MKGFGQLGKTEDPNWTASEIAQNEKIHDFKTGKEYEYSPNEAALTSSISILNLTEISFSSLSLKTRLTRSQNS